jgi:hypothetical integral membrane protein (TIGR02206 family)
MPDTWMRFDSFTPLHAVAAGASLTLIFASCLLGLRWRGKVLESRLSAGWGGAVAVINLWSIVYWMLPPIYDPKTSLPLHLCDIACLASPFVYLTTWRLPRSLVYFWGIGLSTQAFITPTLDHGPADMRFWLFWLVHIAIVGSAAYDLIVRRFRPTWKDLLLTLAVSFAWMAFAMWVNSRLGANYGYFGKSVPGKPTIIDSLGPWPARVVYIALIGTAVVTVLWIIWPASARLARRSRAASPTL